MSVRLAIFFCPRILFRHTRGVVKGNRKGNHKNSLCLSLLFIFSYRMLQRRDVSRFLYRRIFSLRTNRILSLFSLRDQAPLACPPGKCLSLQTNRRLSLFSQEMPKRPDASYLPSRRISQSLDQMTYFSFSGKGLLKDQTHLDCPPGKFPYFLDHKTTFSFQPQLI